MQGAALLFSNLSVHDTRRRVANVMFLSDKACTYVVIHDVRQQDMWNVVVAYVLYIVVHETPSINPRFSAPPHHQRYNVTTHLVTKPCASTTYTCDV